ncbi:MAG: hypothetical protein JST12_08950 [Armatimonadetes bacterium]|nr:hypothetical protein [Armatimonadota bacterium]
MDEGENPEIKVMVRIRRIRTFSGYEFLAIEGDSPDDKVYVKSRAAYFVEEVLRKNRINPDRCSVMVERSAGFAKVLTRSNPFNRNLEVKVLDEPADFNQTIAERLKSIERDR